MSSQRKYIKISEAAKLLKVSIRTLIRWDNDNKLKAFREQISRTRYYDEDEIRLHVIWFELRREEKLHLRELKAIIKEVEKYISSRPLSIDYTPTGHNVEDMQKAFDAKAKWDKLYWEIHEKFKLLPKGFVAKVDPEIYDKAK